MKTSLGIVCVLAAAGFGGDREQGMQHLAAGRFAEAAASFRAAIAADGDDAELQWNLAFASLRAGDLAAAETAAEKYAALARQPRVDLHAGLLGAVRYTEAQRTANDALAALAAASAPPAAAGAVAPPTPPADPLPQLEAAKKKATEARDHFVRAAAARPSVELQSNTERSLRLIDALAKWIEDLKQQQKDSQPKESGDPQKDAKAPEKDKEKEKQKKPEPKPDEPKPDEAKPEPAKPEDPKPEPEPDPSTPQPEPSEPKPSPESEAKTPDDTPSQPDASKPPSSSSGGKPEGQTQPGQAGGAPGEEQPGRELTVEQAQRVQDNLNKLDQKRRAMLLRQKSQRPRVERDW
jgi:tetratricopeptide (TPR) repeat protein